MEVWMQMVITILCSVLASSGFWAYFQKRLDKRDVGKEMLIGLAHDRILYLGMCYIERGWISQEEYENLNTYLMKPYTKLGGNGVAVRIMAGVDKLPIRRASSIFREEGDTPVPE